jgi:hypothetical protein
MAVRLRQPAHFTDLPDGQISRDRPLDLSSPFAKNFSLFDLVETAIELIPSRLF